MLLPIDKSIESIPTSYLLMDLSNENIVQKKAKIFPVLGSRMQNELNTKIFLETKIENVASLNIVFLGLLNWDG